ncbi:MAG: hypothetical protein ACI86H_000526, partial [bacterium]
VIYKTLKLLTTKIDKSLFLDFCVVLRVVYLFWIYGI